MVNSQKILIMIVLVVSVAIVLGNLLKNENLRGMDRVQYSVLECSIEGETYETYFHYFEENKTLLVNNVVNCCGINLSAKKVGNTYYIYETQYGDLCKCVCNRKILIYNVERDSRVIFISLDNKEKIISPNLEFCGKSTYSECSSDEDCIVTGCSSQICQSKHEELAITTCEFKDCYDANKFKLICKCFNNRCQWK